MILIVAIVDTDLCALLWIIRKKITISFLEMLAYRMGNLVVKVIVQLGRLRGRLDK